MAGTFDGKIALITGGATGVGFGTAQAFAREGATVVIAARRVDRGEQAVQAIRERGGKAIFIQTDVTQEEQVEALIAEIMERFGRLDCAFNNAGKLNMKPLTAYTLAEVNDIMATNLIGPWLCMKYEIPAMQQNGGGAIVNMSSQSAVVGMGNLAPYAASKGGLISMSRAAAIEYAKTGIRINVVSIGVVKTEMTGNFAPETEDYMAGIIPLGRICTPEDVAGPVLFLCSDAAAYITGENMMIEGGFTAQ